MYIKKQPASIKRKQQLLLLSAEKEGFEPPEPLSSTVFKTAAIDHSAIFPISKSCDLGGARTLDPMIKSHLLYQLSYGVDFLDGTGAKVTLFEKPANDYSKKFLATTIFDTPANDPAIQDNHLLPKPHFPNPFFPTLQTYKAPMGDYG